MEWPTVELDSAAEIRGGATPRRDNPTYWNGDIPWVTPTDLPALGEGIVDVGNTADAITQEGFASCSASLLPPGTVLFSSRASIGKIGIASVSLTTNQGFANLIPRSGLESRYLAWCLHFHSDRIAGLAGSTTFKEVAKSALKHFRIPLPPLPEQRRIVEILDQADRLRRLRADADAKAERILPALFIKMFGDPRTNPMGWPVVQLGDVAQEFISGGTPSTRVEHYWTGDIPWITGADVTDNVVVAGRKWITQEAIENSATHVVPKGAILLVTRTGVGKVAKAGADIAISQDLTGIVLKEGTNADFVAAAIRQKTRHLLDIQQGAIIKGVLRKDVEKLEIPLPALSTQQKFANSVADIMKLEANRSESHRRLETLFQTTLHRAFTGDLTASWREAHKKELLQEMEQ